MHGDFELLAATWKSMAIKWKPTKNSLVKKGDVLEVCIALCMACPTQSLAHRKKFLDVCAKLNHMLDRCAMRLFSGNGDPILKTVPNPTNYGRFLLYCYFEQVATKDDDRAIFSRKAFAELLVLVNRVGQDNWAK